MGSCFLIELEMPIKKPNEKKVKGSRNPVRIFTEKSSGKSSFFLHVCLELSKPSIRYWLNPYNFLSSFFKPLYYFFLEYLLIFIQKSNLDNMIL